MQSSMLKKSTETIYEIKAPLATFDTIDLDDLDLNHGYSSHGVRQHSPEKCAAELSETIKEESVEEEKGVREEKLVVDVQVHNVEHAAIHSEQTDEPRTPTPVETKSENEFVNTLDKDQITETITRDEIEKQVGTNNEDVTDTKSDSNVDIESEINDMTESGNITPTEASTGSRDANSSENNASAEEIQNQLKQKGRKQKEKASNVKYQQIDSFSDVSDQEKESPLPSLKIQSQPKPCGSDSESSDSDSDYVRKGFISTNKGLINKDARSPIGNKNYNLIGDFVDSDTTPYSSPKPRRPTVPPPLSKEESAIISKRKAYEKRLKRLQVTTNPIERPRSTTPINIYGLEEYVYISSPEKSPRNTGNLQKLKITLPADEGSKGKSPRRGSKYSRQRSSESPEANVFTFNEDLLFTHTKAAILVEDDTSRGFSPKRVLVPPTLSPHVSPRNIPAKLTEVISPATYMVDPWESIKDNDKSNSDHDIKPTADDCEDWAVFDSDKDAVDSDVKCNENDEHVSDKSFINAMTDARSGDNYQIDSASFPNEELLTVHIDEAGDSRICDISCEPVEYREVYKADEPLPLVDSYTVDTDNVKEQDKCGSDIINGCSVETTDSVITDTVPDLGTPV